MKQPPVPAESNDLAIASLVLGILSLTGLGPLTGIPALITGWLALKKPGGRGMAIAGLVTGGIATFLTILVIFVTFLFLLLGLALGGSMTTTPSDTEPYDEGPTYNYDMRRT